ncbi:unnamed protein product [Mycena citricolor]|uniref:Uncharacterized protein n=1 Tax=Mycena citricolor TaxID=2018698 RepID=A0AAD2K2T1_9AGAR|nr:unnamed protein product [Mycena citricolor]
MSADDWSTLLTSHPIFSPSSTQSPNEISAMSMSSIGRRQVMILKDGDLVVAVGSEIRLASLGATKPAGSKGYKWKVTRSCGKAPSWCDSSTSLGYSRLVPDTIDSKSLQVGQFYHAAKNSAQIAKIQWHPWGDSGSTLMVMTEDGKLREYDISVDAEEPQQVLSFVPERRAGSYLAEDASEREVASFCLGQGRADWGPLTVYAVMKSGDVYSICPYMPKNASIPSSYVHSLECFISAKQEFLSQSSSTSTTHNLSTLYDYQHKYVTALLKQLPPGTVFPSTSRSVSVHPPTTIKARPARQGPFLLQPSPRTIAGSEGGDATDMAYLAFGSDDAEDETEGGETEHLGVVLIGFQDGKVDLCLDVEKVEARWDAGGSKRDQGLPILAVYETIDLGTVELLQGQLDLISANHLVFFPDPIMTIPWDFGHADLDDVFCGTQVFESGHSSGGPERCVSDVQHPHLDLRHAHHHLPSQFALRDTAAGLGLQNASRPVPKEEPSSSKWLIPRDGPKSYVSLLGDEPYSPGLSVARGVRAARECPTLAASEKRRAGFHADPRRAAFPGHDRRGAELADADCAAGAPGGGAARGAASGRADAAGAEVRGDGEDGVCAARDPQSPTDERFARIREEQQQLHTRLERMLRGLMSQASPDLSEHETKWFAELKRMKSEVEGAGKYDERSLVSRSRMLEREYERLMPNLKALIEKEKARNRSAPQLGVSQAFEFGARSNIERARISKVEDELVKLAAKLDIS